jgi:hypothetical protein
VADSLDEDVPFSAKIIDDPIARDAIEEFALEVVLELLPR